MVLSYPKIKDNNPMDTEQINSLSDDILESTSIIRELGISQEDFIDPSNVMKAKEIMEYIKGMPEKDMFMRRSGIMKSENKLARLWEYTQLHKEKDSHVKKLKDLEDMIKRYER